MYKIVFNNFLIPGILFLVTIAVSLLAGFIGGALQPIALPAWMLIGVSLVLFIVVSVALYSKVEIKQNVIISLIMFSVYFVSMLFIFAIASVLKLEGVLNFKGINLSINPVSLALPVIMSAVITKLLLNLESIKKEKPAEEVKKEDKKKDEKIKDEKQPEKKLEEVVVEKKEPEVKTIQETESVKEEFVSEVTKKVELKEESQVVRQEIKEEKVEKLEKVISEEPERLEELSPLGELPSLDGDIEDISVKTSQLDEKVVSITPSLEEEEEDDDDEKFDVKEKKYVAEKLEIPKLAQDPRSKGIDHGGKITSIGKLLVDHRDIENIIETNALMQSVGADTTTTNIISAVAGVKTNEKLAAVKEIEGINSCIVVNQAGFIQASTMDDIHKEQVMGAMASGTFGVINNYLDKISFKSTKDIVFESTTGSIVLSKFLNNIMGVYINSGVSLYSFEDINDFLAVAAEMSPKDIIDTLSSFNGVLGVILASDSGELIADKLIDESKNPSDVASVLPAFYSNLGVFIKNMDQGVLRRSIISTSNEILFLTTIGANILLLYTVLDASITPKDIKIQYETILNS